mgnify:CR=1 FL=1
MQTRKGQARACTSGGRVVLVRGELNYNLLWPSLVKKFEHLPEEVTAPVLIAAAEEEILAP